MTLTAGTLALIAMAVIVASIAGALIVVLFFPDETPRDDEYSFFWRADNDDHRP